MVRSTTVIKALLVICCMLLIAAFPVGVSCADTADTEVYVNMPSTGLDFTVTDKITMTGTTNSVDLSVNNLEVTNNSKIGVINIDKLEVETVDGWTIAEQGTNWASLSADAQTFGLLADDSHDLGAAAYENAGEINPGKTDVTSLTGKTGISTMGLSDIKAADIIVTVSLK